MSDFKTLASNKFIKGALEHQTDWGGVKHRSEVLSELLDIYNYGDGMVNYPKQRGDVFWGLILKIKSRVLHYLLSRTKL